jgi:hypothetical protein
MLFYNAENKAPDTRMDDVEIDEVLARFKADVASGNHTYITLEWMQPTLGARIPPTCTCDSSGPETCALHNLVTS